MVSDLSALRKDYAPILSDDLKDIQSLCFEKKEGQLVCKKAKLEPLSRLLKVGVMFSGGPASGGHNVVWGLFEGLKKLNQDNTLYGFLSGPGGFLRGDAKVIDQALIDEFKNQGGFHMLGSSRDKIESASQFQEAQNCIKKYSLDALVFIGGDDTNTNAYILSQYLKKKSIECSVIGIPKTIDGDLKGKNLEISFGFDTACKVYSEMIGNICTDAPSSRKYTHFIKLMGRKASHVTLECALQTQPNLAFISEEVFEKKMTLDQVVEMIADVIILRAKKNKHYGVILLPEGLIEFLTDFKKLIKELELGELASDSKKLFDRLDSKMQDQLLHQRDPHGNIELSHVATEELIIFLVRKSLEKRGYEKFHPTTHFFGYEGRCAMPTNFDATYCFNLGYLAASMAQNKLSAKMASFVGLHKPSNQWSAMALDLEGMLIEEMRHNKMKLVIEKALVDLEGALFREYSEKRGGWQDSDAYLNPGPIQFYGPNAHILSRTISN